MSYPGYPQPGAPYPTPGAPNHGQYSPPVQFQPTQYGQPGQYPPAQQGQQSVNWMVQPQVVNCPPGLEYLTSVDHLLIKQKVELVEAITTFETKNKYRILNNQGQQIYYAKEDTDCLTRNCCGPYRPFDMKIRDGRDMEVIHLNRPLRCDSCWFPCCLMNIEVTSPPGTVIGSVQQDWTIFSPQYSILDASGSTVLKIEGPLCTYGICGSVEFKIMSADGSTQVGKISKEWAGMLKEMFTDTDMFGVSFPIDLDVRIKAVLLGATFLIDYMFFEKKGRSSNDGFGMFS